MGARQIIKEIDTRRKAGQHQFAFHLLETFPTDGVDGDILQQVRAKLDEYNELKKQGEAIVAKLNELAGALPEGVMQKHERPRLSSIPPRDGWWQQNFNKRRFANPKSLNPFLGDGWWKV